MSLQPVRVRVRIGAYEAEIEAPSSSLKEALELIPELIKRLPSQASEHPTTPAPTPASGAGGDGQPTDEFPEVTVLKDDSLPDILVKIFQDRWGRTPRKLNGVRSVLAARGLIYPKQSVAVALLRLAQSGRLRRFKADSGEYLYTASTSLMSPQDGKKASEAQSLST